MYFFGRTFFVATGALAYVMQKYSFSNKKKDERTQKRVENGLERHVFLLTLNAMYDQDAV